MSGAAVLRRLHDAGVLVRYVEPGQLMLSGPVSPELVELARAVKPELLRLVRPVAEARPCACCGLFFFAEPATTCFWCRNPKSGAKRDESDACGHDTGTSGPTGPAYPAPSEKRACPSCGGGLSRTDAADGCCWSCRYLTGDAR